MGAGTAGQAPWGAKGDETVVVENTEGEDLQTFWMSCLKPAILEYSGCLAYGCTGRTSQTRKACLWHCTGHVHPVQWGNGSEGTPACHRCRHGCGALFSGEGHHSWKARRWVPA